MVTIALRRPVRAWWPALLACLLVVMAGAVSIATAPPARAAQNPASCASSIGLVDGGFEEPVIAANTYSFLQQSKVPGWSTTATDSNIEIWHNNFNGVTAAVGTQFAELNATQPSALYQDLPTIPGTVMRWSLAHRGRAGMDTMAVNIGPANGTLVEQGRFSDDTSAWGRYSGFYTVPLGQTTTRFSFAAVSTYGGNLSVGNFLDDISFGTNACVIASQTVSSSTGGPYAQAGDVLTITVKATSGGGSPAGGTTVTSPIPAGVSFVPGSIRVTYGTVTTSPTDGSRDDAGEYDPVTRQVVVRVGNGANATTGGSLSNEEVGTVTYQVRVDPSSDPSTYGSESSVRFTDPLTNTVKTSTTNSSSIVLSPVADLAVTLARTSPGAVVAGSPVTFTATLTNNGGTSTISGQDYAYATTLTSQLPAALTGVRGRDVVRRRLHGVRQHPDLRRRHPHPQRHGHRDADRDGGPGHTAGHRWPGPHACGPARPAGDLTPDNDTASVTSDVTAVADVGVTLTATPSNPVAGTDITYTAVLTNRGPSTSRNVVLNDPAPAGTTGRTASVPGGTCSVPPSGTGTVQCSVPTLLVGATTTVTIVVRSDPSRTGTVQNTADRVLGDHPEPASVLPRRTTPPPSSAPSRRWPTCAPSSPSRPATSPSAARSPTS